MTDALHCLPGFMGQGADFTPLRQSLGLAPERSPWQWPDAQGCTDIASYAERCWPLFQAQITAPFYCYAYSMGGRMALHWLNKAEFSEHCLGVFFAGAHTGLTSEQARTERQQHDQRWAQAFRDQPITETLNQWYQQPVFANLTANQKSTLIAEKSTRKPQLLAQQLLAASLATQADFSDTLRAYPQAHFIVGALDTKFLTLSDVFCPPVPRHRIADAGHIVHVEQTERVAALLANYLTTGDFHQ